jgi:hypothetical protein
VWQDAFPRKCLNRTMFGGPNWNRNCDFPWHVRVPPAELRDVALREYRDDEGVTWRVWAVMPSSVSKSEIAVAGRFLAGWLCFDCGAEKRRLKPVPSAWDQRTDHELDALRRTAEVVRKG